MVAYAPTRCEKCKATDSMITTWTGPTINLDTEVRGEMSGFECVECGATCTVESPATVRDLESP